jgi:ribosome biogenesis GTPase / thiamine phosphate phosphatase
MSRKSLGWNNYFEAQWGAYEGSGWVPGRIVSQQRGLWRVAGDFAECWAAASGKLREEADAGGLWPAVGDWVAAEISQVLLAEAGAACCATTKKEAGERAIVHGVLPRRSQFVRKVAGRRVEEQVIAANVDVAFVVVGLGADFNLRRIERYLVQCWESGAKPIIVLNKADECTDVRMCVVETERIAMGVPVVAASALTGQNVGELEGFFIRGETVVLLGSSGVGKSTLLNLLLGRPAREVQAVRESDGRGRHTTTSRELFALPNGTLVIDTPGLRELQLWDAAEGVTQTFADIEELAARCRFRNCSHSGEPGCAVGSAMEAGELDPERLENRRKLEREQEFLRRKIDPEARQTEKQRIKALHRVARQTYEQRKREGGKE